jgi:Xaa-Pro aminopeptidase
MNEAEIDGSKIDRILVRASRGELDRRWRNARAQMQALGIDALVMQSANDWLGGYVKYFTDVPATNGYPRSVIFPVDGLMTIVENGPFDGRKILDGDDPVHPGVGEILYSPSFLSIGYTHRYDAAIICRELARRGRRRIGFVGAGGAPHDFVAELRGSLAGRGAEALDATDLVDRLKAIKSAEEQTRIRCAAALQDDVFGAVLANIRPGMRDVDVAALAWREGQSRGSEQGIILGGSSPLGRASVFVGRHQQGRTLALGDHLALLIEINGPSGFYTEIARTIALGRASQELLDGFEMVRDAQDATLRLLVPGASCREVADAHDRYMTARGLPAELRLYAHGQGYDMVERPLVRRDETMPIQSGMCLAVHPGFETASQFAVICDNYLVGDNGVGDCLHKTEKRVFEVA